MINVGGSKWTEKVTIFRWREHARAWRADVRLLKESFNVLNSLKITEYHKSLVEKESTEVDV